MLERGEQLLYREISIYSTMGDMDDVQVFLDGYCDMLHLELNYLLDEPTIDNVEERLCSTTTINRHRELVRAGAVFAERVIELAEDETVK
jgi:hypothetical protein